TRENVYGETDLDPEFVVPMDAVKRVEIVRGPGSALYGGNAVFGVLNVVTRDGADVNGAIARVGGGTENTARGSLIVGAVTGGGWDIIGGISGYTSQGANDIVYDGIHDAAHNFGHIRNSDYEGAAAGFVKVRKGEFTATFDYETRDHDNRAATY